MIFWNKKTIIALNLIVVFFSLIFENRYWDRGSDKKIFPLLVHSSNGHHEWGPTRDYSVKLPRGWQEPKHLAHFLAAFPRHISTELDEQRGSWGWSELYTLKCWCHRRGLHLLYHNVPALPFPIFFTCNKNHTYILLLYGFQSLAKKSAKFW